MRIQLEDQHDGIRYRDRGRYCQVTFSKSEGIRYRGGYCQVIFCKREELHYSGNRRSCALSNLSREGVGIKAGGKTRPVANRNLDFLTWRRYLRCHLSVSVSTMA